MIPTPVQVEHIGNLWRVFLEQPGQEKTWMIVKDTSYVCEICGSSSQIGDFRGHALCPTCTLRACPRCWKGYPGERRALLRYRFRMVCPECGWKGQWQ